MKDKKNTAERSPVERSPVERSPAEQPPVEQLPVEQPQDEKIKKSKADTAAIMAEAEALRTELATQKQKLADTENTYQRMMAEYINYKRRTEQEKEQLGGFVTGEILRRLLPTLDNFERAAAAPPGDEYKAGIEMILTGFQRVLEEIGLTEIPAQGCPFDPEVHNAVMREDAGEDDTPGTVGEVFQKGYSAAGRVIRPAMVKVIN